ncbi:MAG: DUF433 domain-containing protein [Thermoflexibacter sp.]|jgi:uncharacterized protein (DUF433 family)|nr:DUF433 domain-containing protein [Thermoflexibacter sp.]
MPETPISRVIIDPEICNGKPIIRGKRITVQTILEFLSAGDTEEEILYQYPSLEKEDITACLQFAVALMSRNYTIRTLIPLQNAA